MKAVKKYVVCKLNPVMGSESHLALEEVQFDNGWTNNSFDTEEEAIQQLIDENRTYQDYIILRKVYIKPY